MDEFDSDSGHFRCFKSASAATRHRVAAHGTLVIDLVDYFATKLKLKPAKIPRIRVYSLEDAERAADRCRMQWGLGLDTPIESVIRVLELAGVVVTIMSGYSDRIDAFSKFGNRSVVILGRDKDNPPRDNYDTAHECGHLVMHGGNSAGKEKDAEEQEANRFASAFLMPRAGFFREFPRAQKIDWSALIRLKARWRVSLQAMLRRALDLDIIAAPQYTRAFKELSSRGWRKMEPGDFSFDMPVVTGKMFASLKKHYGLSPRDVADELDWNYSTFTKIANVDVEAPPREQSATRVISIGNRGKQMLLPVSAKEVWRDELWADDDQEAADDATRKSP